MKKLLLLITLISLPSYAAVSANVSFASDYIWRGMTQSDGPAISGGFDYEADGGFYAGIWGSNVNFNDGAGSELDYYFGYGFEAGSIGVDVGYIAYDYPKNKKQFANLSIMEPNISVMKWALPSIGFRQWKNRIWPSSLSILKPLFQTSVSTSLLTT